MITVEAWQEMTRNIVGASGDQAALTALVTQADQAMSEAMNDFTEADEERSRLKEENESLRKANMQFFLQLTERQKAGSDTGTGNKSNDAETITIRDLFKPKEEK